MYDLTLGVEEEYQIIDPDTRELSPDIANFMEKGVGIVQEQIKPEFLQSQVEVGSNICRNVGEVREELIRLRSVINDIANHYNRKIIAAGTHPFSQWSNQQRNVSERYDYLMDNMQILAKQLLIFGMHVHVGIPDRDLQIDIMNQMQYFMPHVLALSTSSPFWLGNDTGLKSYRSVIFEDLPRTGLPERFNSSAEYKRYVNTLIKTNTIDDESKIWWDIRPHYKFPTLEFRICDCITRIEDVVAITALIQTLVAKLIKLRRENQTWRFYRSSFVNENKWRAVRHGIDGKLIDLGREEEIPFAKLVEEMIDFVDDVARELGTQEELKHLLTILKNGTSADMQLQVYKETGCLKSVVDKLAEETVKGCKPPQTLEENIVNDDS